MRADVTLNGSDVGAGVLPVVNPNVNLNDYAFNVVKVTPPSCATISIWQPEYCHVCYILRSLHSQLACMQSSLSGGWAESVQPLFHTDIMHQLLQADTTIQPSGSVPNVTRPGSALNLTALVNNASPSSIAFPDGEPHAPCLAVYSSQKQMNMFCTLSRTYLLQDAWHLLKLIDLADAPCGCLNALCLLHFSELHSLSPGCLAS